MSSNDQDIVLAVADYEATHNEQLSFNKGDRLVILSREGDHWWWAKRAGRCGYVPVNHTSASKSQERIKSLLWQDDEYFDNYGKLKEIPYQRVESDGVGSLHPTRANRAYLREKFTPTRYSHLNETTNRSTAVSSKSGGLVEAIQNALSAKLTPPDLTQSEASASTSSYVPRPVLNPNKMLRDIIMHHQKHQDFGGNPIDGASFPSTSLPSAAGLPVNMDDIISLAKQQEVMRQVFLNLKQQEPQQQQQQHLQRQVQPLQKDTPSLNELQTMLQKLGAIQKEKRQQEQVAIQQSSSTNASSEMLQGFSQVLSLLQKQQEQLNQLQKLQSASVSAVSSDPASDSEVGKKIAKEVVNRKTSGTSLPGEFMQCWDAYLSKAKTSTVQPTLSKPSFGSKSPSNEAVSLIQSNTKLGILLTPLDLFCTLLKKVSLSDPTVVGLIMGQYELAKTKQDQGWMTEAQQLAQPVFQQIWKEQFDNVGSFSMTVKSMPQKEIVPRPDVVVSLSKGERSKATTFGGGATGDQNLKRVGELVPQNIVPTKVQRFTEPQPGHFDATNPMLPVHQGHLQILPPNTVANFHAPYRGNAVMGPGSGQPADVGSHIPPRHMFQPAQSFVATQFAPPLQPGMHSFSGQPFTQGSSPVVTPVAPPHFGMNPFAGQPQCSPHPQRYPLPQGGGFVPHAAQDDGAGRGPIPYQIQPRDPRRFQAPAVIKNPSAISSNTLRNKSAVTVEKRASTLKSIELVKEPPKPSKPVTTSTSASTQQSPHSASQNTESKPVTVLKAEASELCPAKGCSVQTLDLQTHICSSHLPDVYSQGFGVTGNIKVNKQQIEGLKFLAQSLTGSEGNLKKLGEFVNSRNPFKFESGINDIPTDYRKLFTQICQQQKWAKPDKFMVAPLNSAACLLHYRVLLFLLDSLSEASRKDFFALCNLDLKRPMMLTTLETPVAENLVIVLKNNMNCPVPKCKFHGKYKDSVRRHLETTHMPMLFRAETPKNDKDTPRLHRLREMALQILARLLGGKRFSVDDLMRYANNISKGAQPGNLTEEWKGFINRFCRFTGRKAPHNLKSVFPVTCVPLLMHFTVMLPILYSLNMFKRQLFAKVCHRIYGASRAPVVGTGTECEFIGCARKTQQMKSHCIQYHLPIALTPKAIATNASRAVEALNELPSLLLQKKDSTVHDLVNFVNVYCALKFEPLNAKDRFLMAAVCDQVSLPHPESGEFTIAPVNSPAALVHWRVMTFLMSFLSAQSCKLFQVKYDNVTENVKKVVQENVPSPDISSHGQSEIPDESSSSATYWNDRLKNLIEEDKLIDDSSVSTSCPIPGCLVESKNMRPHFAGHIPRLYSVYDSEFYQTNKSVVKRRLSGLQRLASWLLKPGADLGNLVTLVNQVGKKSLYDVAIPHSQVTSMRQLCRHAGWPVPENFSLNPLNSQACLIHFLPMMILLPRLKCTQFVEFYINYDLTEKSPIILTDRVPSTPEKSTACKESSKSAVPSGTSGSKIKDNFVERKTGRQGMESGSESKACIQSGETDIATAAVAAAAAAAADSSKKVSKISGSSCPGDQRKIKNCSSEESVTSKNQTNAARTTEVIIISENSEDSLKACDQSISKKRNDPEDSSVTSAEDREKESSSRTVNGMDRNVENEESDDDFVGLVIDETYESDDEDADVWSRNCPDDDEMGDLIIVDEARQSPCTEQEVEPTAGCEAKVEQNTLGEPLQSQNVIEGRVVGQGECNEKCDNSQSVLPGTSCELEQESPASEKEVAVGSCLAEGIDNGGFDESVMSEEHTFVEVVDQEAIYAMQDVENKSDFSGAEASEEDELLDELPDLELSAEMDNIGLAIGESLHNSNDPELSSGEDGECTSSEDESGDDKVSAVIHAEIGMSSKSEEVPSMDHDLPEDAESSRVEKASLVQDEKEIDVQFPGNTVSGSDTLHSCSDEPVMAEMRVGGVLEDNSVCIVKVTRNLPTLSPDVSEQAVMSPVSELCQEKFGPVFDTHALFQGDDVEKFITDVQQSTAGTVSTTGGVVVFCNPEDYDHVRIPTDTSWKVAIGINPKLVGLLTDDHWAQFEQVKSGGLVLGSVGLDWSVSPDEYGKQEDVLNKVLGYCTEDNVLILHVRGPVGDSLGTGAHAECLETVRDNCSKKQKIVLHAFSGGPTQVRRWSKAFPNCHFSFSPAVHEFNDGQKEGLRSIPLEKILIESDVSWQNDQSLSALELFNGIAEKVAEIKEVSVSEVLEACDKNGKRLYATF